MSTLSIADVKISVGCTDFAGWMQSTQDQLLHLKHIVRFLYPHASNSKESEGYHYLLYSISGHKNYCIRKSVFGGFGITRDSLRPKGAAAIPTYVYTKPYLLSTKL